MDSFLRLRTTASGSPRAYRAEDAHGRMVTHLYRAEVHALLALLDEVPSDGHCFVVEAASQKSGSQLTQRWREPDSNHRSLSYDRYS